MDTPSAAISFYSLSSISQGACDRDLHTGRLRVYPASLLWAYSASCHVRIEAWGWNLCRKHLAILPCRVYSLKEKEVGKSLEAIINH